MNYLSKDWIAEQVSAIEKNNATLQESIVDLHNAASETPRLREVLSAAKSEADQLQRLISEQKASLTQTTEAGLAAIGRHVEEVLAAWENPAEEYLRNRFQESESRITGLLDQVSIGVDERINRLTERLEQLQAAQLDHAASLLDLDTRLKKLADDQARLQQTLEHEGAAREDLATAFKDGVQELIRHTEGRHADLEARLQSEASARESLEKRLEESNTHLGGRASEAAAAIGSLEERISASEGSLRNLTGAVTRLNAFVGWFKKAGPFARMRGSN